ncbi:MAG: DUF3320 domain-containing protein, partial [Maritimibacter sp.]|nr:DUF3320 domain-containing protein [Maritimibacter sp.]
EAMAGLNRFVAAMGRVGDANAHPFADVRELDLQPTDLVRLDAEIGAALDVFREYFEIATPLTTLLGWQSAGTFAEAADLAEGIRALANAPGGLLPVLEQIFSRLDQPRLVEALSAGRDWATARDALAARVTEAAWELETSRLRPALVRGETSFFARIGGAYRRASAELAGVLNGQLPKKATDRRVLVDDVANVQSKRRALGDDESYLAAALGEFWRGDRTDFSELLAKSLWAQAAQSKVRLETAEDWRRVLEVLPDPAMVAKALEDRTNRLRAALEVVQRRLDLDLTAIGASGGPQAMEDATLSKFEQRLRLMQGQTARYDEWSDLKRAAKWASDLGAVAVVNRVLEGTLPAGGAELEFDYACAEAGWKHALAVRPALKELAHLDRHDLVALFRRLEQTRFEENRDAILSVHYAQVPKGSAGEIGIIRGEIARKRGHKPIRWVMGRAGTMVQRIKPVFLMSPLSVAQFLPPGSVKFDLLIIDEASQVRPEDALGVVARARQIVVVGDEKQLPPNSFFDRIAGDTETDDEEEALGATAADMESILTLCDAKGVAPRMLEWHYRSRDPSLIRVSNAEFYGDRLVLPPSPLELDENYGLRFNRVPGVYSSASKGGGRAGTNKIEAQEVVKAAARHAREWPTQSLGIVAFSKAQADMLTEVLEHARRSDPVLDAFLREGQNEDVFVKNIENVQGDERDVILISVGYGPHEPGGRLAGMNFGPVNGEGGERRLNVLFSRARVRCEVFASFTPGDIDLTRTTREGPRVLKQFLDYAASGILDQPHPTGLDADSPFEEDVASEIYRMGYTVDPQVGSAGFRVDLAVRNPDRPGQYLLAV